VNKYTVPFPKPSPTSPKVFQSSGKTPIQVVHFSDVHIDRQYAVSLRSSRDIFRGTKEKGKKKTGSEANCTKPICCRNYTDNTAPASVPAGPDGNHKCDSPVTLADSMLGAIEQFAPNNLFSIFTGDVVEGKNNSFRNLREIR